MTLLGFKEGNEEPGERIATTEKCTFIYFHFCFSAGFFFFSLFMLLHMTKFYSVLNVFEEFLSLASCLSERL